MRSLYGSVRAGEVTGSAVVKLTFDAWKEGDVAPATASVSIQPPPLKPDAPKFEPLSAAFAGTLPHPAKGSTLPAVRYLPDGKRLLVAGDMYSGVVQLWDVDARKEVLRIAGPKPARGNSHPVMLAEEWGLLAPDGKTVYMPVRGGKVSRVERDGKKADLIQNLGTVRRWDVAAKKELDPFSPPAGWGNHMTDLSPGGRFLYSLELKDWVREETGSSRLVIWDTTTGKRSELDTSGGGPMFLPDDRGVVTSQVDKERNVTVRVHSLPDGKEVVSKAHPGAADWAARLVDVAADGKLIAVNLGGAKGKPTTTLFLDAKTLDETARWTAPAKPIYFGHTDGRFTPDGKRFVAIDGENNLNVFDIAAKKTVRTVKLDGTPIHFRVSPDGRWFGTHWMPDRDKVPHGPTVDPDVLPQTRVELVDLNDPESKPVTLIAPRGIAWGMAFRPDGKQLALGGSGGVHLFDLTKLK
jgi:WD40 repeat protein